MCHVSPEWRGQSPERPLPPAPPEGCTLERWTLAAKCRRSGAPEAVASTRPQSEAGAGLPTLTLLRLREGSPGLEPYSHPCSSKSRPARGLHAHEGHLEQKRKLFAEPQDHSHALPGGPAPTAPLPQPQGPPAHLLLPAPTPSQRSPSGDPSPSGTAHGTKAPMLALQASPGIQQGQGLSVCPPGAQYTAAAGTATAIPLHSAQPQKLWPPAPGGRTRAPPGHRDTCSKMPPYLPASPHTNSGCHGSC